MRDGGPLALLTTSPTNLPLDDSCLEDDGGCSCGAVRAGVDRDIICAIVARTSVLAARPATMACMSSGRNAIVLGCDELSAMT